MRKEKTVMLLNIRSICSRDHFFMTDGMNAPMAAKASELPEGGCAKSGNIGL